MARPRLRFAPSPTGYLHVGGARTALFNWLYARHAGGTLILRIEDTDFQRSTQEMVEGILVGMRWLGITWDEGPFYQSQRLHLYGGNAEKLVTGGHAYFCFCPREQLEQRRAAAQAEGRAPMYERTCRRIPRQEATRRRAAGDPCAIRFAVPEAGSTAWDDAVFGRLEFSNSEIEDFVLLRSDGVPTYHLSVVTDDLDMRITHVLRGADHISNTPKQILLYAALAAPLPVFAHVPMINGPDGKKLSKRHGATAVGDYQHLGILPAALRNFLALLGWSPGGDKEIMTLDEMIQLFTLEGILKKPAVFDPTKLEWMNGQYLSMTAAEELYDLVAPHLETLGVNGKKDAVTKALTAVKTRSRTTIDIARQVAVRLDPKFVELDDKAKQEIAKDPAGYKASLQASLQVLKTTEWTPETLEKVLRSLADERGVAAGKVFQPIRIALTGGTGSEPGNELL